MSQTISLLKIVCNFQWKCAKNSPYRKYVATIPCEIQIFQDDTKCAEIPLQRNLNIY